MPRLIDHAYIAATILFAVYSQLVFRWQVGMAGPLPTDTAGKVTFVVAQLLNPWVISAMAATFLSGVSWMLAMTKFEISYAYPFVGLTFVLILLFSVFLFHEAVNLSKIAGTALVVLGVVIIARGQ